MQNVNACTYSTCYPYRYLRFAVLDFSVSGSFKDFFIWVEKLTFTATLVIMLMLLAITGNHT